MKNKIFRYLFICAVLFLALTLTGCITVTIKGEINSDFTAIYQGEIQLNLSRYEYSQQSLAQESLLKLSEYWQSIGYESHVTLDSEIYHVYYKKQKQCQNYEEAFEELFKLMTDEYSPFYSLSYEYTPYENFSEYQVTGRIDIQDAIDMDVYNAMNDDIKQQIDSQMENLDATVELILPHQESFDQPTSLSKTYIVAILADSITEFEFNGTIYNLDITQDNREVLEKYNYYNKLKYILIGILTVLIILTLVLVIRTNKNKNN